MYAGKHFTKSADWNNRHLLTHNTFQFAHLIKCDLGSV